MSITPSEEEAGALALKTYLDGMLEANGLGWEEMFIPDSDMQEGAEGAIDAADNAEDQSPAGRLAAAATEIQNAVAAQGYSNMVTPTNCQEAAQAILTAVAKVRAQENPPGQAQEAQSDDGNSGNGTGPGDPDASNGQTPPIV